MDDNRVVTGLSGGQHLSADVHRMSRLENDSDAEAGPARRRQEDEEAGVDASRQRPGPPARPVIDPLTATLTDQLERLRRTDAQAEHEVDDVRHMRGVHHYRQKDPETARFYRRRSPPDGGD